MNTDQMNTDQLLRTLDPATDATEAQRRRGAALLERIVTEPDTAPTASRRQNFWRVGAILAGGAVVAAVAIVVPGLSPQSAAVASWTAEAEPVAAADLAVAEKACRAQLDGYGDTSQIPLTLSERRGDVVALLFYRENPETASSCMVDMPAGSASAREVTSGSGGSSGAAMVPPADSFIEGAVASYTLGGQVLSVVTGSVGPDVTSMTLRGAGAEAVVTISDGHYAAWLPGNVFTNVDAPSGKGGPEVVTSYDLTLADGTVIENAKPSFP
jgi:hypothetical protein